PRDLRAPATLPGLHAPRAARGAARRAGVPARLSPLRAVPAGRRRRGRRADRPCALGCLPVYRTSVRPDPGAVDEDDARRIVEATETARAHRPDLDGELFEFLRDLLRRRLVGDLETELTMRFQQLSGPVMAK